MPARYARLPNSTSDANTGHELEDAFELGDEDDNSANAESTPLVNNQIAAPRPLDANSRRASYSVPGSYDFERQDYDFPPPGSPPPPSSNAIPNNYGNSNGLLPTSPAPPQSSRPSFFRRAVGALLPTHYARVPSSEVSQMRVGGGTENDGVFANVMAKPQAARVVTTEDGNVHVVPEDSLKEAPPSYAEAQADAVPPYWETTVHAPAGLEPGADMIIDDLPTGSFIIFAVNLTISFFFQFVGFLLTYILHTSHAAKFGSRAGLGITLIRYGFYSRTNSGDGEDGTSGTGTSFQWQNGTEVDSATVQSIELSPTSRDWLSFLFMTLGWFLLLSSFVGFWRVKRWESTIRTPVRVPSTPEEIERDLTIRRNIEHVFGLSIDEDPQEASRTQQAPTHVHRDANGNLVATSGSPSESALAAEARLTRDLRDAGLI